MNRKFACSFALLLAALVAAWSEAVCPTATGRWGYGPVRAVAASGSHAYFGSGSVLEVADLTNPASVPVVGRVLLPDSVRGLAAAGSYVYVGANQAGLRVVDVSNPAAPVEVGSVDTGSYAVGVAVAAHYVYLADGWDGLRIFDVANPAAPFEVGAFDTPLFARDVAISGSTAYVVDDNSGLFVVDVSDPAHPSQLGALAIPGTSYGVALAGTHALVAATTGLYSVDVSNPAAPTSAPAFSPACGTTLFDVASAGSYAYVAGADCGISVISIANPAAPVEVGAISTSESAEGIALAGTLALVADGAGGLSIATVASPASPAITFTIATPDQTEGIAVDGDHAFLAAASSGLRVLSIADPSSPGEVAALPVAGSAASITIANHLAYIGANGGGLRIVDVANPTSPALVGSADAGGGQYDIALSGSHAFTINGAGGLEVFDVAEPAHPSLVATLALPGANVWRLAAAGNFVFVADAEAGLRVVDVAVPSAPTLVSLLPIANGAQSVVVAGTLAYVGDYNHTVHVVDIVSPATPTLAATVPDFLSNPSDLFVGDGFLVVGNGDSGVSVLSLADPIHPEFVGSADTPGQARGVVVAGSLVAVADLDLGAAFFDLAACPATLCTLSCSATAAPAVGLAPLSVAFAATATESSCGDVTSYDWNFGDGSPHSAAQAPSHTYGATGTFTWTATITAGFHQTTCSGAVAVAVPPPRHFDFGTPASPVAAGFARVSHNSTFSGPAGFGWTHGVLGSRDRGTGSDLLRDLVFSPDAGFGLLLADGTYDVTVTMGDASSKHDQMGLSLEGTDLGSLTTGAGQFVTRSRRVRVSDGTLDVALHDLGGADPNAVINALTVTNAAPLCFDFGTPTSPLSPGCARVTHTTGYDERSGFGWLTGTIASRDRGVGTALSRDFDFTPLGSFVVDVADGTYDVVITMGDATTPHDRMGVYLEGALVDTVDTAAGTVKQNRYRVQVGDGQLTVLLDDLGGTDPNVVINGLQVYGGPDGAPGTVSSADTPKPIKDHATVVSAVDVPASPGMIANVKVTLDITHSYDDDLSAILVGPDGTHVRLFEEVGGAGDGFTGTTFDDAAAESIDDGEAPFSGSFRPAEALSAFAGKSCGGVWSLEVTDSVSGDEGTLNSWSLTVVTAVAAPTRRFDFGTPASPLATGYTRVTNTTAYSGALGYGWLSGSIAGRDRGAGGDLNRDFCFTTSGTFVFDLPSGTYDVTVVTGDATARHDQMAIVVEGGAANVITTNAGEFPATTVRRQVTDGQLTVVFKDQGGSDVNVVVNAIEVVPVTP